MAKTKGPELWPNLGSIITLMVDGDQWNLPCKAGIFRFKRADTVTISSISPT